MSKVKKSFSELMLLDPIEYYQNISVDNIIFGYHEKELRVLLQRPNGIDKWMLPGGFIKRNETAEQAASQIIQSRTGLKNIHLRQFKVFSAPGRNKSDSKTVKAFSNLTGINYTIDHWIFQNFITIGFFALTEFSLVQPKSLYFNEEISWWKINELPPLLFDHKEIIDEALNSLKQYIHHHPVGYELLSEKFTLPEIHSLYETILNRKIDIRNFTKKLTNLGLIIKLKERKKIGPHRSPYLYIFNKKRYDQLINEKEIIIF